MKKVSIIVPVYNTEQYLERCLDSLISQTMEDIEILVIDDGSTDNSAIIARKYAQVYINKIIFIQKEKNTGQSDSRNIALKQATGTYVLYVDSDDLLLSTTCDELYDFAEKNSLEVTGLLMHEFVDCIDIQKTPLVDERFPHYFMMTGENAFYHDWILYDKRNVQATLFFYQRDFLLSNSLFYEVGRLHEDLEYYFHVISVAEKVGFLNKTFYQRNKRANSTTTIIKYEWIKKRFLDRKIMIDKSYYHVKNLDNKHIRNIAIAALDFLNGPFLNLILLRPYIQILKKEDLRLIKSSSSIKLKNYRFLFYRFFERLRKNGK